MTLRAFGFEAIGVIQAPVYKERVKTAATLV